LIDFVNIFAEIFDGEQVRYDSLVKSFRQLITSPDPTPMPTRYSSRFHRPALLASLLLTANAAFADTVTQHRFLEARIAPDAKHVASVEGDSASGNAPPIRDLVIRSIDGKITTTVNLPCGRVSQCWPGSPVWTPDSRKLAFTLRTPGSHARTLYQVDADGRNLNKLLEFNGTIESLSYGPQGQLAMLATQGATKESGATEAGAPVTGDLDEAPPEQRIAILEKDHLRWASPPDLFVYEYDWQPDGRGFAGTAAPGDGDKNWWVAKLYAFDVDQTQAHLLYAPSSAQQQLVMPKISRDGKRIAFIAGLMSDFGSIGGDIYTLPLNASSGGAPVNITPALPASVTAISWNCDGNLLATVQEGDQNQFVEFGKGLQPESGKLLAKGQDRLLEDTPQLQGACPSKQTALLHETFNHASEIEVGTPGHWRELTHANDGIVSNYDTRSLTWNSDQYKVQGWLVLPKNTAPDAKLPLITIIHGGPSGVAGERFLGTGVTKMLLEHGYALFLPNPRGSFGQGEAFTAANVRDFGYGDLRDILRGLDAVIASAPIDPNRIGVTGHSYGGYMTMWAVTQTDRFKAAVADAGISNWQSYYGENGIDEWLIPFFGASVYDDPAIYAKSSPISFIRQIHTPTLSMVGDADIECPAPQTQEFGHALKALSVPSSTVIYPGEGHHFNNPTHIADRDKRLLEWFDHYLR
jgi:dipeptidyl aminopeptidase/acylaminoacyl peptidase